MSKLGPPGEADIEGFIKLGLDIDSTFKWAKGKGFDLFGWLERNWWMDNDLGALLLTVIYCDIRQEPLPTWASLGVFEVLTDNLRQRGDRSELKKGRHLRRWSKVSELRELAKDRFMLDFGRKKTSKTFGRLPQSY